LDKDDQLHLEDYIKQREQLRERMEVVERLIAKIEDDNPDTPEIMTKIYEAEKENESL